MRKPSATYERMGKRAFARFMWIGIAVLVVVGVVITIRAIMSPPVYRTSYIVSANPSHIISWSSDRKNVIMLDVPSDVVIDTTHGYGSYSVGSVYSLDHMDHRKGEVFVSSLTQAFGIPLFGFVAQNDAQANEESSIGLLRSIFSWPSIWSHMTGQAEGSIPFGTWISLVMSAQTIPADGVKVLRVKDAYVPTERPDGSQVPEVDPSRLDYLIGNAFLDSSLRSEGMSVAVYNTTNVGSIGQRAARLLSRLGLQLVFVGNRSPQLSGCQIQGTARSLSSRTARFIRDYFHCVNAPSKSQETNAIADLVVSLGTEYADQFTAKK